MIEIFRRCLKSYTLSDQNFWISIKTEGGKGTQMHCGSRYSIFIATEEINNLLNVKLHNGPLICKSGMRYDHRVNVFY